MIRIVPALALAVILLSVGQASFAETPAEIVKERQDAMENNWSGYYKDIAQTLRSTNRTSRCRDESGAGHRPREKIQGPVSAGNRP